MTDPKNARPRTVVRRWEMPQPALTLLLLNLLIVVAVAPWWPIYQTPWQIVTGAVALALANMVAVLSFRHRWPLPVTVGVAAAAYIVGAFLSAVPGLYSGYSSPLAALTGVVTAPVAGVKKLLTLQLPVGDYQQVLALLFFAVFVIALLAISIALRARRLWWLAAPLALTLMVGGIAFGSSAPAGTFTLGPWQTQGGWQLGSGVAAFLLALLWVTTRQGAQRRQELNHSLDLPEGKRRGTTTGGMILRGLGAAGLLVLSVAGGTGLTGLWLQGHPRDTLRAAVQPWDRLTTQTSPLVTFRAYTGEELFDTALFTADVEGADDTANAASARVRLATLADYDGTTFEAVNPNLTESQLSQAFQRVPAEKDLSGAQTLVSTITIDTDQGPWVPLVGQLEAISFEGPNRANLTDGFYFNDRTETGVQLAEMGLVAGTQYTTSGRTYLLPAEAVTTFVPEGGSPLFSSRTATSSDAPVVPASLAAWVDAQGVTRDGAGLLQLIHDLRERGYLSHSLTSSEAEGAAWVDALDGYDFVSARAGHSLGRVDTLFATLMERQLSQPEGADDALLVAAAGDEEQFAAAAALLANHFGFRARIAVGALLQPSDPNSVAPCEDGVCRGQNMTAWVEIQDDATGQWAAVDVRPQHTNPIAPEVEQRSDPKNNTPVDPLSAVPILPPDPNPSRSDIEDETTERPPASTAAWGNIGRIVAVSICGLIVLLGPPLLIVGAKALRRRSRQRQNSVEASLLGGWEEYADYMEDRGWEIPASNTRRDTANQLRSVTPSVDYLARIADQATFTAEGIVPQTATTYWEVVKLGKRESKAGLSWYQKVFGALSLRSLRSHKEPEGAGAASTVSLEQTDPGGTREIPGE